MINEEFKSSLDEYFELGIPWDPVEHIADIIYNSNLKSKFNRVEMIELILSFMSIDQIKDNIDYFIKISIIRKSPEITVFLLDCKAKYDLCIHLLTGIYN